MQLDLCKNELVFSSVPSPAKFAQALQGAKNLKFRKHLNRFYIPLAYLDVARQVLKEYVSIMRFTIKYEMFADRFIRTKGPVKIEWHPESCKISGAGVPFDLIIPQTSYFTKTALQSKAYTNGQWDGMIHLFDVVKGVFPSGLLERVVGALVERDIPYSVERKFDYPAPVFKLHPVFPFTPTEDQLKATEALEKANNGIAKLPTGFGKTSFVAASLIAKKGVKSMFLANQRVLINDAKSDFLEVFKNDDIEIGTIGDGEFNPGDITVASIQSIHAALSPPTQLEKNQMNNELSTLKLLHKREADPDKLKEYETKIKKAERKIKKAQDKVARSIQIKEYLKSVALFIVDESQVLGTDMWNDFLRACPAPYRYTLSATDTRTDGGRIQIVAATGERRYESSASEQIEKGRLSEFIGFFQKFDHGLDKEIIKDLSIDHHEAYRLFIVENEDRNSYLCDWLIKWAQEGNSVLGLVTRAQHGEIIQSMLLAKGMKESDFEYVDGKTPKKQRQENIERFRNGEFPILIGTSIFDVGFNAKNASKIVRFNAGASEVREPQRAGRTVRMRDDGSRGESIDVIDLNVPYFEAQGWKRLKLLKEEFGDHRAVVLDGVIKSEFEISRLEEVVAEMPDQTNRLEAQRIIDELKQVRDLMDSDIPEVSGISELEDDRNLASMLDQLTIKEGEW